MTDKKLFLTIPELASRYAIDRKTLWEWRRDGKFPLPMPIGGHPKWRIEDIEAFERRERV